MGKRGAQRMFFGVVYVERGGIVGVQGITAQACGSSERSNQRRDAENVWSGSPFGRSVVEH